MDQKDPQARRDRAVRKGPPDYRGLRGYRGYRGYRDCKGCKGHKDHRAKTAVRCITLPDT